MKQKVKPILLVSAFIAKKKKKFKVYGSNAGWNEKGTSFVKNSERTLQNI